jgi:hypothetical protein
MCIIVDSPIVDFDLQLDLLGAGLRLRVPKFVTAFWFSPQQDDDDSAAPEHQSTRAPEHQSTSCSPRKNFIWYTSSASAVPWSLNENNIMSTRIHEMAALARRSVQM